MAYSGDNLMLSDTRSERRDAAAAEQATERRHLAEDFISAFHLGPQKFVRTPGWGDARSGRKHATVADVIGDGFSGVGDTTLDSLLVFVSKRAKAGDAEAQKLIESFADDYADFHAGQQ